MCLAVPGRIVEIGIENGVLTGRVDFALSKNDGEEARKIFEFHETERPDEIR